MPTTQIFTNKLEVKVDNCNRSGSIYLKWIGTKGGWNYFLFKHNKIEGLTTTAPGIFSPTTDDLALADSDTRFITKTAVPEIMLSAENLDAGDLTGIKSLLWSPQVFRLLNPEDWDLNGAQWQTVKVQPGKFTITQTNASLSRVEFVLQLVQINILSQ